MVGLIPFFLCYRDLGARQSWAQNDPKIDHFVCHLALDLSDQDDLSADFNNGNNWDQCGGITV